MAKPGILLMILSYLLNIYEHYMHTMSLALTYENLCNFLN